MFPGVCLAPWLRVRAGVPLGEPPVAASFIGPLWRPGLACGRDFKPASKFYFKRPKNRQALPHKGLKIFRRFTLAVVFPRIMSNFVDYRWISSIIVDYRRILSNEKVLTRAQDCILSSKILENPRKFSIDNLFQGRFQVLFHLLFVLLLPLPVFQVVQELLFLFLQLHPGRLIA